MRRLLLMAVTILVLWRLNTAVGVRELAEGVGNQTITFQGTTWLLRDWLLEVACSGQNLPDVCYLAKARPSILWAIMYVGGGVVGSIGSGWLRAAGFRPWSMTKARPLGLELLLAALAGALVFVVAWWIGAIASAVAGLGRLPTVEFLSPLSIVSGLFLTWFFGAFDRISRAR